MVLGQREGLEQAGTVNVRVQKKMSFLRSLQVIAKVIEKVIESNRSNRVSNRNSFDAF